MISEMIAVFILITGILLGINYALTGEVKISVSVAPTYNSCTVALDLRQDYYLEYNQGVLVNMTPIGDPIIMSKERIKCS